MEKILFISRNEKVINKSVEILSETYEIILKILTENFSFFVSSENILSDKDTENTRLIILDTTNLELEFSGDKYKKSSDYALIEQIKDSPIKKLLILEPGDDAYYKLGLLKYNDFVSVQNLENELLIRTNLLSKNYRLKDSKNLILIGDLIIDNEKYELRVGPKQIDLTYKEFEFLKYLVLNENKVVSRNVVLSTIWGYDFYGGSRTVDVHMRRLRSKIPPPYNEMLKTVRNVGYMFTKKI